MIELKYETVEELNDAYIEIFKKLKPNSKLFRDDADFDMFFNAQMAEYKFYLNQILERDELVLKFKIKSLKFYEESEELNFEFIKKKEEYSYKMQKKMNKKLFRIFKKKCALARKKGIEFEQEFYEEQNKEFANYMKAKNEIKKAEEQQAKDKKQELKQEEKNEKANAKQGIVVEYTKVEAPKENNLLEHKEGKQ